MVFLTTRTIELTHDVGKTVFSITFKSHILSNSLRSLSYKANGILRGASIIGSTYLLILIWQFMGRQPRPSKILI